MLKKKTGVPYSKKMVARFIGLGILSTIAFLAVSLLLDIKKDALKDLNEEALLNMPGWEYVIPMLIGAILAMAIVLVGMILMLRRIGVWSKNGEKQERITEL